MEARLISCAIRRVSFALAADWINGIAVQCAAVKAVQLCTMLQLSSSGWDACYTFTIPCSNAECLDAQGLRHGTFVCTKQAN